MSFPFRSVVDLSHPIAPGMPTWPKDPEVRRKAVARRDRDGYNLHELCLGEHTGTHLGAPSHMVDGPAVHQIPPEDLIVPAVVFDAWGAAMTDPDRPIALADVLAWEGRHGRLPARGAFLLWTGWSRHWPDKRAFLGLDGAGGMHFPGLAVEAARWLVHERQVRVLGTDAAGIDPGQDRKFAANRLLLAAGGMHLECLTNLDKLPPTGVTLFIGALKIAGGSGSPARVLALF